MLIVGSCNDEVYFIDADVEAHESDYDADSLSMLRLEHRPRASFFQQSAMPVLWIVIRFAHWLALGLGKSERRRLIFLAIVGTSTMIIGA